MTTPQSFISKFNRLRQLGLGRLEAFALLMVDPFRYGLSLFWRVCVAVPFFLIGASTFGLWLFFPVGQLVDLARIVLGDHYLMNQIGKCVLLCSVLLEGMRYVWSMNASLLKPVLSAVETAEGKGSDNLKDKQR
ncbi:hypothetical protein [Rahnella aceris]|jgi:hypothetical protein|uniref:hypothetical protein n=1 Tax=Rahnella sp. (strain Y9602) TaxID=2703885 RepID=UPI001C267263|nr:hypothetical protein [Rahnella aceris]MBU9861715.1 hypothetical protein [Rahnella aceris]